MTFIESARLYLHMYPGPVADQIREILKIYDMGTMEHGDCVLRICTVFSDMRYEKEREDAAEERVIAERGGAF